ncbi:hypothetical protein VULLAG_LOCUS16207 [Vulpes lagopus]
MVLAIPWHLLFLLETLLPLYSPVPPEPATDVLQGQGAFPTIAASSSWQGREPLVPDPVVHVRLAQTLSAATGPGLSHWQLRLGHRSPVRFVYLLGTWPECDSHLWKHLLLPRVALLPANRFVCRVPRTLCRVSPLADALPGTPVSTFFLAHSKPCLSFKASGSL